MRVRRIVMIEPKSPGNHVWSIVRLPRLGMFILGTQAKQRGIEVRVIVEEQTPVDFGLVEGADLLCLTTTTSTAPAAYQLADRARAAGIPVIIGGPHVTFLPDEAMRHADWVMRGEADRSFATFLDMLEGHEQAENVPGLSHRQDGQVVHNQAVPEPVEMDQLPIPDFSLLVRNNEARKFRFPRNIIPIQTSRGCPHHCRFCSVTPMFGHRLRFRSNELVEEELNRRRGQGNHVFFYDDNFCGSPRRAKSLLDHLLTKNTFLPKWSAQVSVRAARDHEMLALMQRAGCYSIFVGFESVDPDTLSLYHKRQSVEDIRQAIRTFHKYDMWVHGMFVTGSDADRVETIRATADFAIEEELESIQFLVLTPLPGTPVYDEMSAQGRLLTTDWSLYDAHHTVFKPARMSPLELTAETMSAMGKVYRPRRFLSQLVRGKFNQFIFNSYAHRQVKRWRKENRPLVRAAKREASRPVTAYVR